MFKCDWQCTYLFMIPKVNSALQGKRKVKITVLPNKTFFSFWAVHGYHEFRHCYNTIAEIKSLTHWGTWSVRNRCWNIVNWTLRNKLQWYFSKMHLFQHMKMPSAKWQLFCLGLNVFSHTFIFIAALQIYPTLIPYPAVRGLWMTSNLRRKHQLIFMLQQRF